MRRFHVWMLASVLVFGVSIGCRSRKSNGGLPPKPAAVNGVRLMHADGEPGNWMTYGGTYKEQRFSELKEIESRNVSRLGLTWYYDLDTHRGQEATPLVVDGVMYVTSAWSKVYALNAATGNLLWSYDPKVPGEWGVNACCDVVNRGVAVWNGKVIFGTLDGRLIALDAATGKPVWSTLTIDPQHRYTITGAPRVAKGLVFIGNGGAEMDVRGYVSAYDAETGKLVWRFYTVPGDPSKPFESAAMEKAAKTWRGKWWTLGGGGTVWNSIVYDPELDQLYIGTGNRSPWTEKDRGRGDSGDSLYTCSIVALKPETGEYLWHYQEESPDIWDYDADEDMILADLSIAGASRKVLMQAAKNGLFYVLDRTNGALISAKPFTNITWATGVDMQTGRPIETPGAHYKNLSAITPGPLGAHSWQPMAFSPQTMLAYIPVNDSGFAYKVDPNFKPTHFAMDTGTDSVAAGLPQEPKIKQAILNSIKGKLVAWDPVQQKQAWAIERPGPWNGGTLATAGNLVFEGTADGHFEAYRADNGQKLWSFDAQTGVMAGPISYAVNGDQYVAVLAGWGGVFPLATGEVSFRSGRVRNVSRMLVFKLGGTANLPALQPIEQPQLKPPPLHANPAEIHKGEALFQQFCSRCHGDVAVSGGVLPDLRYSSTLWNDQWFEIVLGGMLKSNGMVSFSKDISRTDAAAIRSYVISRAHEAAREKAH
jgi:quinohemoprotein ethanol dehydrogenase